MARTLDQLEHTLHRCNRERRELRESAQTSASHLTSRVGSAHRHFSNMYDQNDAITEEIGLLNTDATSLQNNISPINTSTAGVDLNSSTMDFRLSEILITLDKIKNV